MLFKIRQTGIQIPIQLFTKCDLGKATELL